MGTQSSYDLVQVKALVRAGAYAITNSARRDALQLAFSEADILDCILGLDESDCFKTMPAEKAPGLMQDVYRPLYEGQRLYVKLQIATSVSGGTTVVISFKRL